MKAIVTTQYGPPEVLQLREIATPAPAVDQVLIKLYASSVNPLDSFAMRGPLFFLPRAGKLLRPKQKVIGADIAGRAADAVVPLRVRYRREINGQIVHDAIHRRDG